MGPGELGPTWSPLEPSPQGLWLNGIPPTPWGSVLLTTLPLFTQAHTLLPHLPATPQGLSPRQPS